MGSSGGGSQVVRQEPPKYQLPYLQQGLQSAANLYGQQAGGQVQTVAPFSPETEAGLKGISDRANAGSPLQGAANQYALDTLNGNFLGSNPWLDKTYERAALQTQSQLASQFAGTGRNVDASEGLRAQQLNDLATGIYGGAYDAERNRQQQVLGMSPAIQAQDYADYDRLLGVGAQRENLAQQQLDAPGLSLDQYLSRVSGNYGQTTTTPYTRNRAAGAIGGGMAGAQMGGQIGGYFGNSGWGSAIGGLLGAYGGGWG